MGVGRPLKVGVVSVELEINQDVAPARGRRSSLPPSYAESGSDAHSIEPPSLIGGEVNASLVTVILLSYLRVAAEMVLELS
jgi:hypothetical protein